MRRRRTPSPRSVCVHGQASFIPRIVETAGWRNFGCFYRKLSNRRIVTSRSSKVQVMHLLGLYLFARAHCQAPPAVGLPPAIQACGAATCATLVIDRTVPDIPSISR